ncbi:NAD-dependent succinate-semialdehyde dehydrogenase [Brevibacterium luteolum]|uniref:NAD-dependent succinate-semialdehyde dehydrogenase n=1 Tax=Brevibacterium luteolum TaxID=199591 RepID=UPI003B67FD1A
MNAPIVNVPTGIIQPNNDLFREAMECVEGLHLDGGGLDVFDPASRKVIAAVPDHSEEDVIFALNRAFDSGQAWRCQSPRTRGEALRNWYDLLVENAESLARLLSIEAGKTLPDARAEVRYGCDFVRWYSEEVYRIGGVSRGLPDGGGQIVERRSPVGLSVLITPWNFPFAMATRKIAPAIAAGCSAVIKPAAETPISTYFIMLLAVAAGIPDGLVEVVSTSRPQIFSDIALGDERVRKLSFTGSTEVGRSLSKMASERVLRTSLELGGNAPFIVFDDADLDKAIEGAFSAKLRNGGQSCIAANRFYLQDGIADDFVAGLSSRFSNAVVGHGLGDSVDVGPLISSSSVKKMVSFVDDAVRNGGEIVCGGEEVGQVGSFFAPTLIDNVPDSALMMSCEVFGPVAPIQRFSSESEVIVKANGTDYGLAAYVFSENLDRAYRVSDSLESGVVGINQGVPSNAIAPFGGVKASGLGREGGDQGIEEYLNVRFYNVFQGHRSLR